MVTSKKVSLEVGNVRTGTPRKAGSRDSIRFCPVWTLELPNICVCSASGKLSYKLRIMFRLCSHVGREDRSGRHLL